MLPSSGGQSHPLGSHSNVTSELARRSGFAGVVDLLKTAKDDACSPWSFAALGHPYEATDRYPAAWDR